MASKNPKIYCTLSNKSLNEYRGFASNSMRWKTSISKKQGTSSPQNQNKKDVYFYGNFLPQVYVENAKSSFYADTLDNYNIFF